MDDPLQWRLQRKKGNPRSKNAGWRDRSFCTTRKGLLRCVREYCGSVDPSALATLTALPFYHATQNLDVQGRDQARADGQSKPILGAIAEAFSTDIFSEYEPQYWGYDTQEEWEAAWVSNGKRA